MASQERLKLPFDPVVRRSEDLATRHDDHINGSPWFVVTEQLADQAFGAIAFHSVAHLARRCYTKTRDARLPFPREHRHEASGALEACLIDELKIRALPDVLARGKAEGVEVLRS
jgi:hypothetical protein